MDETSVLSGGSCANDDNIRQTLASYPLSELPYMIWESARSEMPETGGVPIADLFSLDRDNTVIVQCPTVTPAPFLSDDVELIPGTIYVFLVSYPGETPESDVRDNLVHTLRENGWSVTDPVGVSSSSSLLCTRYETYELFQDFELSAQEVGAYYTPRIFNRSMAELYIGDLLATGLEKLGFYFRTWDHQFGYDVGVTLPYEALSLVQLDIFSIPVPMLSHKPKWMRICWQHMQADMEDQEGSKFSFPGNLSDFSDLYEPVLQLLDIMRIWEYAINENYRDPYAEVWLPEEWESDPNSIKNEFSRIEKETNIRALLEIHKQGVPVDDLLNVAAQDRRA